MNADSQINDTLLGTNLFAYCENNPVNMCDPNGTDPYPTWALNIVNGNGSASDIDTAWRIYNTGNYTAWAGAAKEALVRKAVGIVVTGQKVTTPQPTTPTTPEETSWTKTTSTVLEGISVTAGLVTAWGAGTTVATFLPTFGLSAPTIGVITVVAGAVTAVTAFGSWVFSLF